MSTPISNDAEVIEISLQGFNLDKGEDNNHDYFEHGIEYDLSFEPLKIELA